MTGYDFLTIVIVITILLLLWYRRIYSFKGISELPSPPLVPFIGHLLQFIGAREYQKTFSRLQELQGKYGDIFVLWTLRMSPYVMISDPKIMEYFLISTRHIKKTWEYTILEPWLGRGLLTSTGNKWHNRRKILTPAFHFKILEQFIDIINKNGNVLITKLSQKVNEDVDIYPYINLYALDVICETAMGTSINAQINETTEYVVATRAFIKLLIEKIFSPWKQFNFFYNLSNGPQKEQREIGILHKFTRSVIEKRRRVLLENRDKPETDLSPRNRLAFLDLLLQTTQDGEPLSDEDIREEVDTFMFEGHDTVSSGLSFLLYELTKHRDVQEKINNELNLIFGETKIVNPTYADLQRMNYLELVIKEGLRLYPPVPLVERELEEDVRITSDFTGEKQYCFAKGTSIIINAFRLHRRDDIYPEAEKFIPERFLKENVVDKSPFTYLPFSAGPRNCIGQKFAMMEMKSSMAKICKSFVLEPVQPSHKMMLYSDAIMKSFNGLPIRIRRRERSSL